jgi:hypothetical protein
VFRAVGHKGELVRGMELACPEPTGPGPGRRGWVSRLACGSMRSCNFSQRAARSCQAESLAFRRRQETRSMKFSRRGRSLSRPSSSRGSKGKWVHGKKV